MSTGSTRCWNIKEGRWNQCRLTWHSIVSPPNLHFPKYHHYSIHTNTKTNTLFILNTTIILITQIQIHIAIHISGFQKIHNHMKKTFEILVSLNSPYSRKNRGAIATLYSVLCWPCIVCSWGVNNSLYSRKRRDGVTIYRPYIQLCLPTLQFGLWQIVQVLGGIKKLFFFYFRSKRGRSQSIKENTQIFFTNFD